LEKTTLKATIKHFLRVKINLRLVYCISECSIWDIAGTFNKLKHIFWYLRHNCRKWFEKTNFFLLRCEILIPTSFIIIYLICLPELRNWAMTLALDWLITVVMYTGALAKLARVTARYVAPASVWEKYTKFKISTYKMNLLTYSSLPFINTNVTNQVNKVI